MLKHLATWNINSIRPRLDNVAQWLDSASPDVVCFQETKVVDELFPIDFFTERGYTGFIHGQKSYNGVAIFSKFPIEEVKTGLGMQDDFQARYLEAWVYPPNSQAVKVVCAYIPNGNPINTEKFPYKKAWLQVFSARILALLEEETPLFVCGDYNIIPTANDVYDVTGWDKDALYHPDIRKIYQSWINQGYTDCVRACNGNSDIFTFWNYLEASWPKNKGLRIDHILASPKALDTVASTFIHRNVRGNEKPSDHVPVSVYWR